MKTAKNIAGWILVFALSIGFCWILSRFFPAKKEAVQTITVTKTVTIPGDSIPYPIKVLIPVPHDSIVTDTLWQSQKVDTAEILRRYFARYFYNDTIRDTSFIAIIQEVITQNRIIDRQFKLQNTRAQAITYVTNITTPSPKWYVGPSVSYNGKVGFGASGLWRNNNHAFGLNIDVTNRMAGITYMLSIKP
jgi:hypothetical protein